MGQDVATAGANEIDTLVGGQGGDRFILGDENMVFYSQSGENDYALITDFDDGDRLTLQGSSSQYRVQNREGAIALFHRANGANDLIVVLEGRGILDLQGEQVTYQS